ncbi:MAG: BrnT family toxin [Desulfobulbus sp.]|jgi:uncharacterized DUF497 family protein
MKIDFDPVKSAYNQQIRNLPFSRASDFDWDGAVYAEDCRNQYPERRFVGIGYLDGKLHVICFTPIPGGVRVISFRKANRREAKRCGKPITID